MSVKKRLTQKGIPFKEITSVAEMHALGFEWVPVLCVDGTFLQTIEEINAWIENYGGANNVEKQ